MSRLPTALLAALLTGVLALVGARPATAAEVTIYRCTDAGGRLTLRDTPCGKGQKQETRTMLRPKDAPRRAATRPAPARAYAQERPTRVIVVNTPRPLYECATPDGRTYTSESPEGNPRWMPLWALDYPVVVDRPYGSPYGGGYLRYRDGRVDGVIGGGVDRGPVLTPAAYGVGTWVRDICHALPQDEVCARLVDRRDAIRRRFFNAMPSERATLTVEERGINARLGADCGEY